MFHAGTGSNGLAVLCDMRTKTCAQLHGCLDLYGAGIRFLGKLEWRNTLRIAIRDYGEDPYKPKELLDEKKKIWALLRSREIRAVIVLGSPEFGTMRKVDHSFSIVGPGGSVYRWAGTCWRVSQDDYAVYCLPVLNPSNYEHVYEYLIRRWFKQGLAVANGNTTPIEWGHLQTEVNEEMALGLETIIEDGTECAVDIETNLAHTIITAIGFSNGATTVSVPWHGFRISGTDDEAASLRSFPLGPRIERLAKTLLASSIPKILHNGAFDVYELANHGITLSAFEHDTLLLHRVVYPQFRHGLQQAAATEFCVQPWKCLWKPPSRMRGTDGDIWLSDPAAMHLYNCKDALITWKIFQSLKTKLAA